MTSAVTILRLPPFFFALEMVVAVIGASMYSVTVFKFDGVIALYTFGSTFCVSVMHRM